MIGTQDDGAIVLEATANSGLTVATADPRRQLLRGTGLQGLHPGRRRRSRLFNEHWAPGLAERSHHELHSRVRMNCSLHELFASLEIGRISNSLVFDLRFNNHDQGDKKLVTDCSASALPVWVCGTAIRCLVAKK